MQVWDDYDIITILNQNGKYGMTIWDEFRERVNTSWYGD